MTRTRKWLLGIAIAIAVLIVAFFAALSWVIYTPSGLRFALDRGVGFMHGQLAYTSASGTLAGETTINGLRFRDASGDVVQVRRAMVELQPWALLGKKVHIRKARIDGVTVDLAPPQPAKESKPFSLKPPITL
ncbi:MAG: translocation/assembly module TamB domain-containing protein, partial [Rhodanobacteraceae bacterium]